MMANHAGKWEGNGDGMHVPPEEDISERLPQVALICSSDCGSGNDADDGKTNVLVFVSWYS